MVSDVLAERREPTSAQTASYVRLEHEDQRRGDRADSLAGFVGQDTYRIDELYADLHRFVFLLGLNDGEQLFGEPTP